MMPCPGLLGKFAATGFDDGNAGTGHDLNQREMRAHLYSSWTNFLILRKQPNSLQQVNPDFPYLEQAQPCHSQDKMSTG